jgi:hypothetical protein
MKIRIEFIGAAILLLLAYSSWKAQQVPIPDDGDATGLQGVIVIYESKDTTPAQDAVMKCDTAKTLNRDGKWKAWDKNSVPPVAQKVVKLKDIVDKLPYCYIIRQGKLDFSGPLPKTPEAFTKLVAAHGGT